MIFFIDFCFKLQRDQYQFGEREYWRRNIHRERGKFSNEKQQNSNYQPTY